jgi:hypothetical protein
LKSYIAFSLESLDYSARRVYTDFNGGNFIVKIKIFMALLISALVLSACNSNGNQEDQKTDDYGSGNVAITNDANTEKNTYTEANKDNTEETTITLTDSNDTTGDAPLIKPAYAEKNADEMTDNELLSFYRTNCFLTAVFFRT